MSKPTDLVQCTLDLLILKTVALEPMHGWAMVNSVLVDLESVAKLAGHLSTNAT